MVLIPVLLVLFGTAIAIATPAGKAAQSRHDGKEIEG
jgi:hypothetical protein